LNAVALSSLGEQFDTVLDCGLFHSFGDDDRARFVKELRASMPVGGHYYMLCFSDRQAGDWGPRRIRQEEIRGSFAEGWTVDSIQPAKIDITIDPHQAQAWLAVITRS
jgi:cyclopropane fatty-acyl-phospholipid synthase-like methyltransferase